MKNQTIVPFLAVLVYCFCSVRVHALAIVESTPGDTANHGTAVQAVGNEPEPFNNDVKYKIKYDDQTEQLLISDTYGSFHHDRNDDGSLKDVCTFTYDVNFYQSFGRGHFWLTAQGQNDQSPDATDSKNYWPSVVGTTTVEVIHRDGSPYVGASINFTSTQNGISQYGQTMDTTLRGSHAYVVFGYDPTKVIIPDKPYPDGKHNDGFSVFVTAPGCARMEVDGTGDQWPSQQLVVTMDPAGNGLVVNATPPSYADAPPTSGTSDLSGILQSVENFFTPDPADWDALKTAAQNLFNWGPLSLPAQLLAIYNSTFGAAVSSAYDPHYWWLYLSIDNPEMTMRPGQNQNFVGHGPAENVPTSSEITSWSSLFPDHFDLTNYQSNVLTGRAIVKWCIWIGFVVWVFVALRPQIKI